MTDTSLNPTGAGFFNAFANGALRQQFVVDPDVDGSLPIGTVVEIETYDGPGNNERTEVPQIQPSSTDDSTSVIGVVSLGSDLSGAAVIPPGAVATVTCVGVTQVLCDATTVAGDALVQSPTTPGAAQTSSAPTTRAFGVALQSVDIESGTALVWAYIAPGGSGGGGGGGIPTLQLTYNGEGPATVQVIDSLTFDPAVGGTMFALIPASISPTGSAVPAFISVQPGLNIFAMFIPMIFNNENIVQNYDDEGIQTGTTVQYLILGQSTGNPGNQPGGVDMAQAGMLLADITNDVIWFCTTGYNPAGPTDAVWIEIGSGGGAPTLNLSYNGAGPSPVQVLDGLAWNPVVGGYIFAIMPGALSGIGIDVPAIVVVDNTGTIQGLTLAIPGTFSSFGPTLNPEPIAVSNLEVSGNAGNPGNTPQGFNAQQGQIYADDAGNGFWFCTQGYTGGPADAVWVNFNTFGVTVNNRELITTEVAALAVTSQPLVNRSQAQIQPLPPLFGFTFTGATIRTVTLGEDSTPGPLCAGPDGNLWVCDTGTTPSVWKVPFDGSAPVQTALGEGSIPNGIAPGPGGYVWVQDSGRGSTWAVHTDTGVANEHALATGATPGQSCAGPDGGVWALDPIGTGGGVGGVWNVSNGLGATVGVFYPIGTVATTLVGLCAGPDGNLWSTDSAESALWMITTDGVGTNVQPLAAVPGALTTGADGQLWMLFPAEPAVASYNIFTKALGAPVSIAVLEPPPAADPVAIIPGGGGDLWAVDTTGLLWKITTDCASTVGVSTLTGDSFPLPGENGNFICVAQDGSFVITQTTAGGAIWFVPFILNVAGMEITQEDVTFHGNDAGPTGPVVLDQADGHTYRLVTTAGVVGTVEVS